MPRKTRLYHCVDCGVLTFRKRKSYEPRICIDCGRDRMVYAMKPWKRPKRTPDPPETCTR